MTDVLSPQITRLEATPAEIGDAIENNAAIVWITGSAEWTGTALDTLTVTRIPVEANLLFCRFAHDDMATTSITVDIGFYQVGGPGTVINADALAEDDDWDGAAVHTEHRYDALGIETAGQKVWELAGLAARPAYPEADIVVTSVAATAPLAGTVAWEIAYTL